MGLFGITDFIRNFREASKPTSESAASLVVAPAGERHAKFYTYNDSRLPKMRKGDSIIMKHVIGKRKLVSKYTGTENESDCCFAYDGTIVGCVFARSVCQRLLDVQDRCGSVAYSFVYQGRSREGWQVLELELPPDAWFAETIYGKVRQ